MIKRCRRALRALIAFKLQKRVFRRFDPRSVRRCQVFRPVPSPDLTRFGGVWRWCSGAAFVILLQFCIGSVKVFRRFDPQKLQRSVVSRSFFYLSGAVGIAATLLQLYNAVLLNAFWPFFTAIVVQLIAAMFQFARMILRPPEEQ